MAESFIRKVRLTVAKPIKGDFAKAQPNARVIEDLRVQFKVSKSLTKDPNTAEITVTNLAEVSRADLANTQYLRVALEAGYEDDMPGLFIGDARTVQSKTSGTEWLTVIQAGESERAVRFSRVNKSFRPGTDVASIAANAISALGLDNKQAVSEVKKLNKKFSHGYTSRGRTIDELDRLLAGEGLEWSIQGGSVLVVPKGKASAETVVELSSDTGLVGSPEYCAGDKKRRPFLKVRCFCNGRIVPAGRVNMNSLNYKGLYRVVQLTHTGDTAGGEWYTDFEAEKL